MAASNEILEGPFPGMRVDIFSNILRKRARPNY